MFEKCRKRTSLTTGRTGTFYAVGKGKPSGFLIFLVGIKLRFQNTSAGATPMGDACLSKPLESKE
jgi:hypothetical protein